MTTSRALSWIRDAARTISTAGFTKVAAAVLIVVLAAGCTIQVSPPSAGSSGSQGASQSGVTTTARTSPGCATCSQLMSEFPELAAIGLSALEDLLEQYGPDVAVLLWAAALILDL
jgi:hypothetical protein